MAESSSPRSRPPRRTFLGPRELQLAGLGLVGLLVLVTLVGILGRPYLPAGRPGSARRIVTLEAPVALETLGPMLERKGIVRSSKAFIALARFTGGFRRWQGGSYGLSPGWSLPRMIAMLDAGRGRMVRVTVPEGYSLIRIAHMLDQQGVASGSVFLDLATHPARFQADHRWLAQVAAGNLEGCLFPDTYLFDGARVPEDRLIDQMLSRFHHEIVEAYVREVHPRWGLRDALTLASIVELEAAVAEERPVIAGVFARRLDLGMPLGSDPTVEYALGWHQGREGLRFRDIAIESPYNTYRHTGLPPGPIGNPGRASFEAALHPTATPYLYFVARGGGRHAFSVTYQEHLAAQRRVRRQGGLSNPRP